MIRLAFIYFASVFSAGFVLGVARVKLLVPQLGTRYAELIEIPVMLTLMVFIGGWVAKRSTSRGQALGIGIMAFTLLLSAELGLAALLFGKSPVAALTDKDPVSGSAYYLSLVVFALMPACLRATRHAQSLPSSRKL